MERPLSPRGRGPGGWGEKNIPRKAQLNTQNHSGQYAILASSTAWPIMVVNQVIENNLCLPDISLAGTAIAPDKLPSFY
jgi:hypothetical protein